MSRVQRLAKRFTSAERFAEMERESRRSVEPFRRREWSPEQTLSAPDTSGDRALAITLRP